MKYLLIGLTSLLLAYIFIAFVKLELNVTHWSMPERGILASITFASLFVYFLYKNEMDNIDT